MKNQYFIYMIGFSNKKLLWSMYFFEGPWCFLKWYWFILKGRNLLTNNIKRKLMNYYYNTCFCIYLKQNAPHARIR